MPRTLVFAADTLVRPRNGRLLVHTTSSPLPALNVDQPMLIGWLCQFAVPTDADSAIAALPPVDRTTAAQIIDFLVRGGTLVDPGDPAARERSADEAAHLTRQHLRLLARSVYDLACDIHGLGPQAEQTLAARKGVGIERRLMAILASVDALRQELNALRQEHLQQQLARLGITRESRDLKLHIGCGPGHLAGWVNIDVHPAPLSMNVLWGLPVADGSVRRVFISHLLEHLFFPRDVRAFLAELQRVLAPGGTVRVVVPDIEQCIAAYSAKDHSFFESRRETWSWWPENTTRLEDFLAYAGVGAEPAYLFEAHKYGYDFETLTRVLQDAGFEDIRASTYMGSEDPELRVDDASSVAKARYGDRYYSLFVEARKPAA